MIKLLKQEGEEKTEKYPMTIRRKIIEEILISGIAMGEKKKNTWIRNAVVLSSEKLGFNRRKTKLINGIEFWGKEKNTWLRNGVVSIGFKNLGFKARKWLDSVLEPNVDLQMSFLQFGCCGPKKWAEALFPFFFFGVNSEACQV